LQYLCVVEAVIWIESTDQVENGVYCPVNGG